jgi:hypothetical protein
LRVQAQKILTGAPGRMYPIGFTTAASSGVPILGFDVECVGPRAHGLGRGAGVARGEPTGVGGGVRPEGGEGRGVGAGVDPVSVGAGVK